QAVGAHEFILRLENGYATELQERGTRLSLGQRQLVALARALLADPRILILDEATSSVDIGTERKIEQALRLLLAGRTAFIIAHRLSTIRDADLIVVLEHGQIVEQGSHDELLQRRGLYTSVFGLLALASGFIGTTFVQGALVEAVDSEHRGIPVPSVGGLYRSSWKKLGSLVWLSVMTGVGVALGLLLFVVPGVLLAIRWTLA